MSWYLTFGLFVGVKNYTQFWHANIRHLFKDNGCKCTSCAEPESVLEWKLDGLSLMSWILNLTSFVLFNPVIMRCQIKIQKTNCKYTFYIYV